MVTMEDRKKQIELELFVLKLELNSFYGVGQAEVERCERISKRTSELREELNQLTTK